MENERNMYRCINSRSRLQHEKLSVGGKNYASRILLPKICGSFYKKHPEIGVTIDIGSIGEKDNLLEKLKKGVLELVLSYDYDTDEFEGIPLLEERLFFVMHKDLAGAKELSEYAITRESIINKSYAAENEIEDVSAFRSICFVNNRKASNTSQRMSKILGDYKLAPYAVINVKQIEILYNLMLAGIGAVMVSDLLIANSPEGSENLLYFLTKSPHSHRTLYIIKKKAVPLSPIAEEFVSIALDICK